MRGRESVSWRAITGVLMRSSESGVVGASGGPLERRGPEPEVRSRTYVEEREIDWRINENDCRRLSEMAC